MNTPVSFETAKLLKDKGFKQDSYPCYGNDGKIHTVAYFLVKETESYFAPTISDVVKWVYEKHGVWINVDIEGEGFNIFCFSVYRTHEERITEYIKKLNDDNYHTNYKTPTEAYQAAIEYTLNNLI